MKLLTTVLILATAAVSGLAQHPVGSLLIIETANHTSYARDVTDYSLLATNPGPTTETPARNFQDLILIGDIVSVNGKPAKGTIVETAYSGDVNRLFRRDVNKSERSDAGVCNDA